MYVASLRLVNFARYEDQTLDFHPGFNSIIGQSDAGKSTILRALIWVFYNRPTGMEMCREGSDETTVTLTTSEGVIVSRVRSKKRNAYEISDTNGILVFDSVKTDVPLEVSQALGIHFAELGKQLEMLNVSRQMDGPFMLASSGSDAAKILGSLSGVTTLDTALGTLRPDLSSSKRDLEGIEKIERAYAAAAPEYADLGKEEKRLATAATAVTKAQEASLRLAALRDLQGRMKSYNTVITSADVAIAEANHALTAAPLLAHIQSQVLKREGLLGALEAMASYNHDHLSLDAAVREATLNLDRITQTYTETLKAAGTCPLCGARQ
jgi:DNA repair exonuclease SbcCD ATPase subunit